MLFSLECYQLINIYITLNENYSFNVNDEDIVIFLQKPLKELSKNEYYTDLNSLDFGYEDIEKFYNDLKSNDKFIDFFPEFDPLINEFYKYVIIPLFNLTKFIDILSKESDFELIFDRKINKYPVLSILLGNNTESGKVFLHDIRDTIYPLLSLFYGNECCVNKNILFDLKVFFRTYIIFIVTVFKCTYQTAKLLFRDKKDCINVSELHINSCVALVRSKSQIKNLRRLAKNQSFNKKDIYVFSQINIMNKNENLKLIRLPLFIYFFAFVNVFFKTIFNLFTLFFVENSVVKYNNYELNFNFMHQYWNYLNKIFLDELKSKKSSVISFEMCGRHSQFHQKLCSDRLIPLHRIQVATIVPRHVKKLTFYGKLWAFDKFCYDELNSFFSNQISFDNYISPIIEQKNIDYSSKRILFATQPYGIADNFKIINILLSILDPTYNLVVRRHPRDFSDYQSFSHRIYYDDIDSHIDSIVNSGLVVSKTSTILNECYNLNIPYISVLFDDFSRSVNLGFTKVDRKFCMNDETLILLVKEYLLYGPHHLSQSILYPNKLPIMERKLFCENI